MNNKIWKVGTTILLMGLIFLTILTVQQNKNIEATEAIEESILLVEENTSSSQIKMNGNEIPFVLGDETALENNASDLVLDTDYYPEQTIFLGHNNHWGSKMGQMTIGTEFSIVHDGGLEINYIVSDIETVNETETLNIADDEIIFYTCYPFDDYSEPELRYVVYAKEI